MNDGTAGGAIAAMQAAGIDPKTIPTTGQDAELEAVQRILTGDQYMTVYKATKPEAQTAAKIAVASRRASRSRPLALRFPDEDQQRCKLTSVVPADPGRGDEGRIGTSSVSSAEYGGRKLVGPDGFWTAGQVCTSASGPARRQDRARRG